MKYLIILLFLLSSCGNKGGGEITSVDISRVGEKPEQIDIPTPPVKPVDPQVPGIELCSLPKIDYFPVYIKDNVTYNVICGSRDLIYINQKLNENYILAVDINMDSYYLNNPIFKISSETTPFTGIFNGNYKSISGFKYNSSTEQILGFITNIDSGQIKNLTLANIQITTTQNGTVGPFGKIVNTIIDNVSISFGLVQGTRIGGIVGFSEGSLISNVNSTMNLQSSIDGSWGGGVLAISNGGNRLKNVVFKGILTMNQPNTLSGGLFPMSLGMNLNVLENVGFKTNKTYACHTSIDCDGLPGIIFIN